MGLFSSKYVTSVATNVSRVINDNALPNSIRHGAIKGIFTNDGQMVEHAMEDLTTGVGVRANQMYNYGGGAYPFGLPSGSIHQSSDGQADVQAAIQADVGGAVTIDYFHYGALNNLHVGWMKLLSDHGYDASTNQINDLTTAKATPVYLTNLVVVVTNANLAELSNGSLAQWGLPATAGTTPDRPNMTPALGAMMAPTPFEVDPAAANDYVRVEYMWLSGTNLTVKNYGALQLPIVGFNTDADYVQVRYLKGGVPSYWLYQIGSGGHPTLDTMHNPSFPNNGSYFPFGYFRFNKIAGNVDKTSTEYKASKKLVGYLGMNYDQITDAIHQNPGIANVQQALLTMSVPAVTTDQLEMRYLFDYFANLYAVTGGDLKPIQSAQGVSDLLSNPATANSIIIQDKRFKMALGFSRIYRKKVVGNLGKVGTYASGVGIDTVTQAGKTTGTGTAVNFNSQVKSHYYQRQISAEVYEEVRVVNLKMTYYVFDQYTTVGDENNEDILLIPLDKSITTAYSVPDKEKLYARSLHYVFNSVTVTEVKWYAQGWFAALLTVIAIVITVWTYGSTWQALAAALANGTVAISTVMYIIAIQIFKYMAVTIALKLFVKAVGVKIAFIVAIIAALAGGYQAIETGAIKGAPWAEEMLSLSTGLSKSINVELKAEYKDLKSEYDSFSVYVKEQQKKIDDANNLLHQDNYLTPDIIFGESPTDYYQRTVHSGNIGVLGLDAIAAYVDVALTLPKFNDTVGDTIYA